MRTIKNFKNPLNILFIVIYCNYYEILSLAELIFANSLTLSHYLHAQISNEIQTAIKFSIEKMIEIKRKVQAVICMHVWFVVSENDEKTCLT